jgi:hypothetical protein
MPQPKPIVAVSPVRGGGGDFDGWGSPMASFHPEAGMPGLMRREPPGHPSCLLFPAWRHLHGRSRQPASSTAAATGGPIRLLQSLAISIWALPHRAHLRQPHCAKGGKPVDLAARWSPSREDLQGEWERLRLHGIPVQNCKNCTFSQNIQSNESACSCSCTVRVCILILSAQAHPGRRAKIPHTNSLARSAASMCRMLARAHLGNGWPAPNIAL